MTAPTSPFPWPEERIQHYTAYRVAEPPSIDGRLDAAAWGLVRALYPEVSKIIETKLAEDPKSFIEMAEKAMSKQQAIIAAEAEAEQAEKNQKEAEQKVEKVGASK